MGGDSQRARLVGIRVRARVRPPFVAAAANPIASALFCGLSRFVDCSFFRLRRLDFVALAGRESGLCADKRNGAGRWPDNERRAVNRIRRARPRVRGARRARFAGGVYDRGIPGARRHRRRARSARRRRGHHRSRRAVFGSGRGRNGDPTRIRARARQRNDFAVGVVANPRLSRPAAALRSS